MHGQLGSWQPRQEGDRRHARVDLVSDRVRGRGRVRVRVRVRISVRARVRVRVNVKVIVSVDLLVGELRDDRA